MKHTVRSAVCALLCAAVMLLAPAASLGESAPKDYAASVQPDTHDQALQALVTVQTYVDGDTTHFLLPEGIMEERVISARYLAVNTPECTGRIEEYGKAAAAFTREKLESADAILIESEDDSWNLDSGGTRYLVWVWYRPAGESTWRNLNIELLQCGLGRANSSGQNRLGSTCIAAISQAKDQKLGIYSGQPDLDFYYGDAIELTLKELRLNPGPYADKKVAFSGVVTTNGGNTAYVEAFDAETGLYFGLPVYYGYNLNGAGLDILQAGNEVRVVGTMQYYEAGGEYQVAGVNYRMMKPDDPGNLQKLSEGHEPACVEITLEELLAGSVSIGTEAGETAFDRAEITLATSLTVPNLRVTALYPDESGTTLRCQSGDNAISVRTAAALSAEDWQGKTVTVRGVLTKHDGDYRIRAFTTDGIAIQPE